MSNQIDPPSPRPYRKQRRAQQEEATRARIAEATAALHETVGPACTSVKAIAERAGVQRATVYRHFPDDEALFQACTGHFYARHPMPDPGAWAAIAAPADRLRCALGDLYGWYAETEQMLSNVTRDAEHVPPAIRQLYLGYFDALRTALMARRPERGRRRARTAAAIGHAIGFATWRSLVREQGLDERDAVALMEAMVAAASRPGVSSRR